MKKYFLDCGSNVGQSIDYFINNNLISSEFIVHIFEPNIKCIEKIKERLSNERFDNYIFNIHNVAVWNENCYRSLTLEYSPEDYKCQLNNEILSGKDYIGGASNILEYDYNKPKYIKDEYLNDGGQVECVDFSEFLFNNIEKDSYVICKMDIEGSEFSVLNKLFETKTIYFIDELYIEWHSHLMKSKPNVNYFKNKLKEFKIEIRDWI